MFGYPFGFGSGLFGFRIFGFKDFISIRVFLNFGSGSVRIFAGSIRVWMTHLNYFLNFKFIIYFK